jgi:hypothetical protein
MQISKKTAMDIALAHREVETATALLAEIDEAISRQKSPDIRDAFGRHQDGLQLGVPSGQNSHRLFNVAWALARPIIGAHIAQQKAIIEALSERARFELSSTTSDEVEGTIFQHGASV